jgi:hypothetical protein
MGVLLEWYQAWLCEQEATKNDASRPMFNFPNEIVAGLRKQAQACEDGERNLKTGMSSWPKETTLEWAAADLLEERLEEIRHYENMRDRFVELWIDMREILGGDDDETMA